MGFKSFFKGVYRLGTAVLLGALIPANIVTYRTLWREHHSVSVKVTPETDMMYVIRSSDKGTLEGKVKEVINETIDFYVENTNRRFRKQLFDFLQEKVGNVKYQALTLEEKVMYAKMFSSSLDYNYKANWLDTFAGSKNLNLSDSIDSLSEFYKINKMRPDEIVDYGKVVCGQFSEVFAAALHEINDHSTNREEMLVGSMSFVPNYNGNYGKSLNILLSAFNAAILSEYRPSEPHVMNIVVTKDRFLVIEPQIDVYGNNPSLNDMFSNVSLDINDKFVGRLK